MALVTRLHHKPACFINGSAVGWYGLRGDEELTEDAGPAPAFTHDICAAWEAAAAPVRDHDVRLVILRIGLVLGVDGGMLAKLLTPFEFGGGGVMGDGRQWMPWIERDDLIRVIAFAMARADVEGPVNATAPNPVRNETFSRDLAKALHRPLLLRFPGWLLSAALGDLARETMLGGQRVLPAALLRHGFRFDHPHLGPMLARITGSDAARGAESHQSEGAPAREY